MGSGSAAPPVPFLDGAGQLERISSDVRAAEAHRIQLVRDGLTAFTVNERVGRSIVFTHPAVPPELAGHGVGATLARGALDLARERGLEVVPLCPFIAAYIRRHPEYLDLVSARNRRRLALG